MKKFLWGLFVLLVACNSLIDVVPTKIPGLDGVGDIYALPLQLGDVIEAMLPQGAPHPCDHPYNTTGPYHRLQTDTKDTRIAKANYQEFTVQAVLNRVYQYLGFNKV